MQAAVYHPSGKISLEEVAIPKLQEGEILLKVRACGVCGTDVLKVARKLPQKPVVLGHELVGEIVEIKGTTPFQIGQRVVVAHHVPCGACHYCHHGNHSSCRDFKSSNLDPGGFAQYLRVPSQHVKNTCFLIDKNIPNELALMTEPLSCCVRNLRRAALLPGDFAVIVGMGSIGLMMVQLLKLAGAKVLALDLFSDRLELAKKLGADFILSGKSPDIAALIEKATEGRKADLVVFTAGGGKTFQEAFHWVRDGGALNLFASLSDQPVDVSIDALYHHEITVFSSYSPSPEDLVEAHRLINSGQINLAPLITHHLGLEDLPQAIELMLQQKALKVIIHPNGL